MARPKRGSMAVRRRGKLWRAGMVASVLLIVPLGWGGWQGLRALLGSDWLTLRYLEIEGCRVLPESDLRQRLEPLLGRPMHTVDPDSLVAELGALPRVAAVQIERRLPGTLRCRITEAESVALLMDGDFRELDESGRLLPRFGDAPPDLPIIRPQGPVPADSLIELALAALKALRASGFDLTREVSELSADSLGLVYTRNETETRVIMGWEDFDARAVTYAQVFPKVAERGFPRVLDLRYRDQVVAREPLEKAEGPQSAGPDGEDP